MAFSNSYYLYGPQHLQLLEQLQKEGNWFFTYRCHQQAVYKYKQAWGICIQHGLYHIAPKICCCNLSKAALQNGWYQDAAIYANSCEEAHVECYLTKAETYEIICRHCQNVDWCYNLCMEKYARYFQKVKDPTSLCQAVMLATDLGLNISETVKVAVKGNFQAVVQTMVQKNSCTETHLQALLEITAHDPGIGVSLSVMPILHFKDLKPVLLKKFITQGMVITAENIRNAITILSNEQVQILEVLTNEVKGTPDYTMLWHLAIKQKPRLAKHFLACGAHPSVVDVMNVLDWKRCNDCTWMIEYITKNCSQDERTMLVLEAIKNHKENVVKEILSGGPIIGNTTLVKQVLKTCGHLLKELILHGMTITEEDVQNAISILSDEQVEVLEVLTKEGSGSLNYTRLWHCAIKDKPRLAKHFLTCGAKPSVEAILDVPVVSNIPPMSKREGAYDDCIWMMEHITKNCSPYERTALIGKAMENGKRFLARLLLSGGPIDGKEISVLHVLHLCEGKSNVLRDAMEQGMTVTKDDIMKLITLTPAILSDEHQLKSGGPLIENATKILQVPHISALPDLLNEILVHGMTITTQDIRDAVSLLSDQQVDLLTVFTDHVTDAPDYASLWYQTLKDKPELAKHFFKCWAHCSVLDHDIKETSDYNSMADCISKNCSPCSRTTLMVKAIENKDECFAEQLLSGGPILGSEIDLSLLISIIAKLKLYSLLQHLLDKGVDPNGDLKSGRNPIKTLLLLQDVDSTVVSTLLCILLKHVSSIDNLEFDDIQSTVIHEITKLSLATANRIVKRDGGNVELLKLACSKYSFPENGILIDKKQSQTPLHIATRSGYTEASKEICQILCQHIDPYTQDKDGNTAGQVLHIYPGKTASACTDERLNIFIKAHIDRLQTKEPTYFIVTKEIPTECSPASACIDGHGSKMSDTPVNAPNKEHNKSVARPKKESNMVQDLKTEEDVSFDFDGLPWEVECTESVLKFLKHDNPKHLKYKIIQIIRRIALGEFHKKLCKKLHLNSALTIYEAKVTKAARLLWEVVIQFSPRCTGQGNTVHIFSEVIRIWSVVLDHDYINHSIRMIEKSHVDSWKAALKLTLHSCWHGGGSKAHDRDRMPRKFTVEQNEGQEIINYVPAASLKPNEYNIVTFYSLTSETVRCALTNGNSRRDFPFKEWHEEYDIINKPYGQSAIILLGRSGTGKTTCCLYRLWNEFHNCCILPDHALSVCTSDHENVTDCSAESSIDDSATADLDGPHDNTSTPQQHCPPLEQLHQVFVTKNPILCAQIKRRFYDLAAGNEHCKLHLPFEGHDVPTCLQNVEDLAYPLFLTAQQFYILLDNSLGEKSETFFPHSVDGTLNVKISSSDYDWENLDSVLDIQDSDSDGEDVDIEMDGVPDTEGRQTATIHVEITASYFVEHIWKNISKKLREMLDPLLVWTEIKSIIKGSFQAVQSISGYLTLEEYEAAGRKMAPNFTGNRQVIYELFQHYQKYKNLHRLFDECDLIHHLHQRLNALTCSDLGWYVNHFYVDEVQDFTQAELALFIRTSRDPNGLFLTGDSAQSIMRGIAFRFCDVRTIFHAAQEVTKNKKGVTKVSVPEISQLTVNFRSHTGVLNLASSIIDLLKHYFSSSIDCLPGDVGMFEGPMPVLVDTCDSGDLALLLRGNKRDKSPIEFGAHQVVIVQSEAAKHQIPDELQNAIVLTVFESKGLEFDDVLLYNFFHDSVVGKEWRVVSEFLQSNGDLVKNKEDVFNQPRPLQFDELLHKSLNSELKYLYTAITRAKCNLWIYDSNDDKRLPMFDYWLKRGLVKVVRSHDSNTVDEKLFSQTSTSEAWKKQGDYFMKRCHWEPAVKCYHKAGDRHLQMEAKGFSLINKARASITNHKLYLQAALALLDSDEARHDPSKDNIRHAAKCLKKGRYLEEASQLFKILGRHMEELEDCSITKVISGCADIQDVRDRQSSEISKSKGNDDNDGIDIPTKKKKERKTRRKNNRGRKA